MLQKKYNNFLLENNISDIRKYIQDRSDLLDYGIFIPKNAKIEYNKDNSLSIRTFGRTTDIVRFDNGYIHKDVTYNTLPFKIDTIFGSFHCSSNELTSLYGSPRVITGQFVCTDNNLIDLKGGPESTYTYTCENNILTTFEGIALNTKVINVCGNKITDYSFFPKKLIQFVTDDLFLDNLENYPLSIIDNLEILVKKDGMVYNVNLEYTKIGKIFHLIKDNKEIFENLLDDKNKFHQMIMRLDSSLIKYYNIIPPPSKNSTLLL